MGRKLAHLVNSRKINNKNEERYIIYVLESLYVHENFVEHLASKVCKRQPGWHLVRIELRLMMLSC